MFGPNSPPDRCGINGPGCHRAILLFGLEVGKVISTYKTAKHFAVTITDDSLTVTRKQDQIDAEATLDGFYMLRTPVPASELDAPRPARQNTRSGQLPPAELAVTSA
jgi:hypothetical protein